MENKENVGYNIRDLLNHPIFPELLVKLIRKLDADRVRALNEYEKKNNSYGHKLRRGWHIKLEEKGFIRGSGGTFSITEVDVLKLTKEYINILNKNCMLSSELRAVISELYQITFQEVIKYIQEQEKRKAMELAIKEATPVQKTKGKSTTNKAKVKDGSTKRKKQEEN